MKQPSYFLFALFFLLNSFTTAHAEVIVSGGQISLNFKDVKLQDALKEIAQKTNMRIVLSQPIEEEVSIGIEAMSVKKVLETLLAQYNYVILTHANGQPREMMVMSRKANAGELAQFVTANAQANNLSPALEPQQPLSEGEAMININGLNTKALIDEGAPTSLISLDVAKQSKLLTPDGREPRDGDYVEVPNFSINGVRVGVVPVIVVQGLPIGSIIGKDVVEQSGIKKQKQPVEAQPVGQQPLQPQTSQQPLPAATLKPKAVKQPQKGNKPTKKQ